MIHNWVILSALFGYWNDTDYIVVNNLALHIWINTLIEYTNNRLHKNWGEEGWWLYWCATGTWLHLQVPGVTGGRGNVFVMAILWVTFINAKELKE